MDYNMESLKLHQKFGGKLEVRSKVPLASQDDLSLAYTPGVAQVCREIAEDSSKVFDLTIKKNTVGIVSDGSAVLGLGNIGAEAAIPVMEGKAVLFKEYAGIDAFPICVKTQNSEEIISLVKNIAPIFGGINLEDITAPRCFEIEGALIDLGIPVFHDDQHGTAIVLLAALINASKLAGKHLSELSIVVNGAGAAGTAIAELLLCTGYNPNVCEPVKEILICDSKGIISRYRGDISGNAAKCRISRITNRNNRSGTLKDALVHADVFIGVSVGNVLDPRWIETMDDKPIILAMANPIPEIMPDVAKEAGAFIVGTGRSDFPNQVNNVLAFPGIFRGALDARAARITSKMKLVTACVLAEQVENPTVDKILPSPLDKSVAKNIADTVRRAWEDGLNSQ